MSTDFQNPRASARGAVKTDAGKRVHEAMAAGAATCAAAIRARASKGEV